MIGLIKNSVPRKDPLWLEKEINSALVNFFYHTLFQLPSCYVFPHVLFEFVSPVDPR